MILQAAVMDAVCCIIAQPIVAMDSLNFLLFGSTANRVISVRPEGAHGERANTSLADHPDHAYNHTNAYRLHYPDPLLGCFLITA